MSLQYLADPVPADLPDKFSILHLSVNHIGIDLGGTKIEGILLDEHFSTIKRKRIPTPPDYSGILLSIKKLVDELNTDDSTIGVCAPGILSSSGLVKNSNTQCLTGKPLREDLQELIGQDISMENDANCFALAEAKMGSAKNYHTVFGVIMGTGVGGGIITDGIIHHGRTGIAGEWGHNTLHHNGNTCYCGKNGCVETYISGPALERRWKDLTGKDESLSTITNNLQTDHAQTWKKEFLENFGAGLADVIGVLDPDAIVLGGGVSNIEFLYDEGRDAVYEKVFGHTDTPILQNTLGDSAGVFGACMI